MGAFNWDLRVPFGYGNTYVTLGWLERWLLVHHHPEYVRRLLAWLHYKDGKVGVGGGWRPGGAQPARPGFAPEGQSFHQDQEYADGFVGAAAVDTVYEDGPDPGTDHDGIAWREVPLQGSAEAARWGIHANVGSPSSPSGESWHIQPVEIDGWQTWWNTGRPAPVKNYPLPVEHDPYYVAPEPAPDPQEEDHMAARREKIVKPPAATMRMRLGQNIVAAPWFYVCDAGVRYGVGSDVEDVRAAGGPIEHADPERYSWLFRQVYPTLNLELVK